MKRRNFRTSIILFALTALLSISVLAQQPVSLNREDKSASVKAQMDAAKAAERRSDYKAAIEIYNRVLEIDPDNYQAHMGLIGANEQIIIRPYAEKPDFGKDEKAMKEMGEKLKPVVEAKKAKYEKLAKDNPTKAVYQLILAYINIYEPLKHQELLYEALRLEPNNSDVLKLLAYFEKTKGNNLKANEIFKKISDLDPQNEEKSFNYYYSFADLGQKQFKQKTEEFIKRFPKSERGAQLYNEIARRGNESERIAYLEKLRNSYPPEKNQIAMYGLFAAYLSSSPDKASAFAREMLAVMPESDKKEWQVLIDFLTGYKQAESLINDQKPADALQILEKIKAPMFLEKIYISKRYQVENEATILFNLLKSRAQAANGQAAAAYEGLKAYFIKSPSDEVRRELTKLGKQLGKRKDQVEADIQTAINAELAKPIKDFSLARYDQNKNVSLADYRGKVVLLNFWYPLCGPCHAEAPFLQRLIDKYGKDKFVILAPNGIPNQDSLVLPFFAGNKYDFIPLKVPDQEWSKNEYQVRGYPTNYLIDKKGNKVYNTGVVTRVRFRQVEIMVEMLLAQKP